MLLLIAATFAVDARADTLEATLATLGKWSLFLWAAATIATKLYERHVESRNIRVLYDGLDVTATITRAEWLSFGKDRQYVSFDTQVEVPGGESFSHRAGLHFRNAVAEDFKDEIQVGKTCHARVDPERPESTLVFREPWASDSASR